VRSVLKTQNLPSCEKVPKIQYLAIREGRTRNRASRCLWDDYKKKRQSQTLWRNSWWFKNIISHRQQKDSNVHFYTALFMNNRNSKDSNRANLTTILHSANVSWLVCVCISCRELEILVPNLISFFHYKGATESFSNKILMHSAASSWLVTICALFQDILYEPIKVPLTEVRYFVYTVYDVWVEKDMGRSSCSLC